MPLLAGRIRANVAHFAAGEPLEGLVDPDGRLLTTCRPEWLQVCRRCGRVSGWADPRWRCGCGGLFDLQGPAADPLRPGRPVVPLALPVGPARRRIMGKGHPG